MAHVDHGGGHGSGGRPVSWVAVLIICAGFTIGGVALCAHAMWWLFWTGVAITIVGGILAFAVDIMADYTTQEH